MIQKKFIKATNECCSFEKHVNAPYLRRSFKLDFEPEEARIFICGLGFYRLFVNGTEITKGLLHHISAIRTIIVIMMNMI